jgi:thioredoxin 1
MSDADTDTDELDEIRRRKREQLERRLAEEDSGAGGAKRGTNTPSDPVHVEGETHLAELASGHDVLLVDFYADWCGPCKMLEPTVEALADESPAAVAKVDVDAHQALASKYGVRGVPTLLLFADGDVVERVVGVRDKGTLASLVAQYAD